MKEERQEADLEKGDEPETEPAYGPEGETDREPEPEKVMPEDVGDGLELDRMEVRPAEEMPEEGQEEDIENGEVESLVSQVEESAPPDFLALLSRYWIWGVAFLLGLSLVSVALLLVSTPREEGPSKRKLEMGLQVVSASLGGEHYVRFNLWGPFRNAKGKEALSRGLPKIRHDLILSEGDPEVARAIRDNDLYFLEKHILTIVSEATGVSLAHLDLKGLSVTRYSDEMEIKGER